MVSWLKTYAWELQQCIKHITSTTIHVVFCPCSLIIPNMDSKYLCTLNLMIIAWIYWIHMVSNNPFSHFRFHMISYLLIHVAHFYTFDTYTCSHLYNLLISTSFSLSLSLITYHIDCTYHVHLGHLPSAIFTYFTLYSFFHWLINLPWHIVLTTSRGH